MPDFLLVIPPLIPADWIRMGLVYSHLISCAFALALVLSTDWRILRGNFTLNGLRKAAHHTSVILVLLWVTGTTLVYHDTGFDLSLIASLSKLQLKLIVVMALTINGVLLHLVSFPLITMNRRLSMLESSVLSISGAISTSHWLLAAFIGIARPLGQWPLDVLLAAYATYVCGTIVLGIVCAPLLCIHLSRRLDSTQLRVDMDRWNNSRLIVQKNGQSPTEAKATDQGMPGSVRRLYEEVPAIRMGLR